MRKTAGALAVLAVVAVAGLVVARGRGVPEVAAPLPPEQAGACPQGAPRYLRAAAASGAESRPSTADYWRQVGWVYVDRGRTVTATLRAARDGAPAGRVEMDDLAASQVRAEVDSGAQVLAAVETRTARASYVAALRPDGSVVFLGECAFLRATRLLEQHVFHAGLRAEPREVFQAAVGDPARHGDWLFGRLPQWRDLPPARRFVGRRYGPLAPRDVLDRFREATVRVTVPEEWRATTGALCVRSPLGWADECAPLAAAPELVLRVFLPVGAPVEVWLVRGYVLPAGPVGRVGRFRAPDAGSHDAPEVRLVADPAVPTFAVLRDVATTTHDALRAG